jgi:Tryptophan-rich Synechocystis species C-terminal domain
LNSADGGRGPLLQLDGGLVTAGEFAAGWTPIEAEKTSSGYQVEWNVPGESEYTVWNVNSSGQFIGDSAGVTSSESALQAVNPGLSPDPNDDAKQSTPAGSLEAYDIIAGGAHTSSFADPAHGAALTGVSSSLTAADLWSAHATFSGGHALMT